LDDETTAAERHALVQNSKQLTDFEKTMIRQRAREEKKKRTLAKDPSKKKDIKGKEAANDRAQSILADSLQWWLVSGYFQGPFAGKTLMGMDPPGGRKRFMQLEMAQSYAHNHVDCGGIVRTRDGVYEVRAAGSLVVPSTLGEVCWVKMHTPSSPDTGPSPPKGSKGAKSPRKSKEGGYNKARGYHSPEGHLATQVTPKAAWSADSLGPVGPIEKWTSTMGRVATLQPGGSVEVMRDFLGHRCARFNEGAGGLVVDVRDNPMNGVQNFTVFMVFRAHTEGHAKREMKRWIPAGSDYNPRLEWWKDGSGLASARSNPKDGDPSIGWGIFILPDGRLGAYVGPEGDTITVLTEKAGLDDGDLHTVALVRDQSEIKLYVDGGTITELTLLELEALHLEWSSYSCSSESPIIGSLPYPDSVFRGELYLTSFYQMPMTRKSAVGLFSHYYSVYSSPTLEQSPRKKKLSPRRPHLTSPNKQGESHTPRSEMTPRMRKSQADIMRQRAAEDAKYKLRLAKRRETALPARNHQKGWDFDTLVETNDSDGFSLCTREVEETKLISRLWISQSARLRELRHLVLGDELSLSSYYAACESLSEIEAIFLGSESTVAVQEYRHSGVIKGFTKAIKAMEHELREGLGHPIPPILSSNKAATFPTPVDELPRSPREEVPFSDVKRDGPPLGPYRILLAGMELSGVAALTTKIGDTFNLEVLPSSIGINPHGDGEELEEGWVLGGFFKGECDMRQLLQQGIDADIVLALQSSEEVILDRRGDSVRDEITGDLYHNDFRPLEEGWGQRLTEAPASEAEVAAVLDVCAENMEKNSLLERCFGDKVIVVDANRNIEELWSDVWGLLSSHRLKQQEKAKQKINKQLLNDRQRTKRKNAQQIRQLREREKGLDSAQAETPHAVSSTTEQLIEQREQQLAALKIQQMTRSKQASTRKVEMSHQRDAVTKIQCLQRGKVDRRFVANLKKQRDRDERLRAADEREETRRAAERQEGSQDASSRRGSQSSAKLKEMPSSRRSSMAAAK